MLGNCHEDKKVMDGQGLKLLKPETMINSYTNRPEHQCK